MSDGELAGWSRSIVRVSNRLVEESRGSIGHSADEMSVRGDSEEEGNRKQTAVIGPRGLVAVRVKRCGKSAPAFRVTGAAR